MTISPRPSMEKWPVEREEGKTSLPGRESRGALRAIVPLTPPTPSFLATIPTGLSADRVATRTITLALNTYCKTNKLK